MTLHRHLGYHTLLAIIVLDQLTKYLVMPLVQDGGIIITPFFNLVLVWNHGISFGMMQHEHDVMPFALSAVALAICIVLHRWLLRAETRAIALGLGLVIGGAIGNVIDRLRFGAVFDFLDFHANGWHWPAFNVADSAICIGVFILLLGGRHKSA